jgi:hypothetical protein
MSVSIHIRFADNKSGLKNELQAIQQLIFKLQEKECDLKIEIASLKNKEKI